MKKRYILIPILIFFTLTIVYVIVDLTIGDYLNISSVIGINVPISCEMEIIDTHGGFNFDGEMYATIYFTDKKAEKFIKKIKENENWKELPLEENLQGFVESLECFDENLPIAQNGYWLFF